MRESVVIGTWAKTTSEKAKTTQSEIKKNFSDLIFLISFIWILIGEGLFRDLVFADLEA